MKSLLNFSIEQLNEAYKNCQEIVLQAHKNKIYAEKNNSEYKFTHEEMYAQNFIEEFNDGNYSDLHYYIKEIIDTSHIEKTIYKKLKELNNDKRHKNEYYLNSLLPIDDDLSEVDFIISLEEIYKIEIYQEDYEQCEVIQDLVNLIFKLIHAPIGEKHILVCRKLIERYKNVILNNHSNNYFEVTSKYCTKEHLLKLCDDALTKDYDSSSGKLDRHLAYIQGVLETLGLIDLNVEIEICRKAFNTDLPMSERLNF